jgi:hypothetical protein
MNINRKIQLTAAAVIANSVLALSLLSPDLALANTCGTSIKCLSAAYCQSPSVRAAVCTAGRPPGCIYIGSTCAFPSTNGCTAHPGTYAVTCLYG